MYKRTVLLSIVMPVFNHPDLVIEMIDSIRANSFEDWELLAVDDGSNEETISILSDYCSKDERITYKLRDRMPKGAPTCRNIGMEMAKGEYIVFFDSDDYIPPYCLANRVAGIADRPELDFMIFPSGTYIDDHFQELTTEYSYGYPVSGDDICSFARRDLPFVVCNNIYRMESLRRRELMWDTSLKSLQDADFNVQAILSGLRYDYAYSRPDYGYRIAYSVNNVSNKIRTKEHQQSNLHSFDKMYGSICGCYGSKYHRDLCMGVQHLYNYIFTDGVYDDTFTQEIAAVVARYSPRDAFLLRIKFFITRILGYVLPKKRARQLPMVCFLLAYRKLTHDRAKAIEYLWAIHPEYTSNSQL